MVDTATLSSNSGAPPPDPVRAFYWIEDDVLLSMELQQLKDPNVLDQLEHSASPDDNCYIQFRERHYIWGIYDTTSNHEDYRIVDEPIVSQWVNYDRLVSNNTSNIGNNLDYSAILGLFDGNPIVERIPQWISSFARALVPVTCQQCGDLKRFLHIDVGFSYRGAAVLARAEREAMEEQESINMVPAHESAIEGLKKECLVVDSSSSDQQCMICLDELSVGSEISSLPCSHVYHWSCVVEWLKTSHSCPTCRYCFPVHVEGGTQRTTLSSFC